MPYDGDALRPHRHFHEDRGPATMVDLSGFSIEAAEKLVRESRGRVGVRFLATREQLAALRPLLDPHARGPEKFPPSEHPYVEHRTYTGPGCAMCGKDRAAHGPASIKS